MSIKVRSKRLIGGFAVGMGLTLGVAALAGAATMPDRQPASEQDQTEVPMLNGSVQAPEGPESQLESEEAKVLEGLATVTPEDAKRAAMAAVPGGTVNEVELEDENGSVVYGVEIVDTNGIEIDVKVDAGNGSVLGQDSDADEGGESDNEAGDGEEEQGDEVPEANETPESPPAG